MGGKTKSMNMYLKLHNILIKPVVKYNSETSTWEETDNRKNGKTSHSKFKVPNIDEFGFRMSPVN